MLGTLRKWKRFYLILAGIGGMQGCLVDLGTGEGGVPCLGGLAQFLCCPGFCLQCSATSALLHLLVLGLEYQLKNTMTIGRGIPCQILQAKASFDIYHMQYLST